MANPPAPIAPSQGPAKAPAEGLVGGAYRVSFDRVVPDAAPPITAFAAQGEWTGDTELMALSVARGWPARARALASLTGVAVPNLITPLAHGPTRLPSGEGAYVVVCPAPRGPSLLATLRPWSEHELLEDLLRPAALALADLHARNVTHRSIRPDNLFQQAQRGPVMLGQAWAAPPGCHQPDWLEPPYSAMCLPCGRGDGSIADDVYALGALMVMLAIGAHPFEGMDADAVLRRKLDVGSFAALVGGHRLPGAVAELVRGMLADDPEHRPSPTLLNDPPAARARRIAARPARRSARPLELGSHSASTARMLAYVLKQQPKQGISLLRSGIVERWIRRGLGDASMATQVDEIVKLREHELANGENRADAQLLCRAIAALDPAAPLTWRSLCLWPDGLGPALDHALHHERDAVDPLVEVAALPVMRNWLERRPARDGVGSRLDARELNAWSQATQGEAGGLRLNHMLNPLAPCESPLLDGRWVTRLIDLLPAIETTALGGPRGDRLLVDARTAAFVTARRDERVDLEINQLAAAVSAADLTSQVRLLAKLQHKLHRGELPGLSRWAAEATRPDLEVFSSRSRRERLQKAMDEIAQRGDLPAIVALVDDKAERNSDEAGLAASRNRLAAIGVALAKLDATRRQRPEEARRTGNDVAGALGLLACVGALAVAVFG